MPTTCRLLDWARPAPPRATQGHGAAAAVTSVRATAACDSESAPGERTYQVPKNNTYPTRDVQGTPGARWGQRATAEL